LDYQYLQVGKLRVRYIDSDSDGSSVEPVLLMHGLGGSIESWANNIDELAKGFRVIAVDLPGFGLSDKPKMNYTIRFYSEFVVQFLRLLRLDQASIVGSSLGGHIAAEVAINYPSLVKRLVLISPAGALPRSFKGSPALWKYVKVIDAKSVHQVKRLLAAVDNNKPVSDSYAQMVYQKFLVPGAKEAFLSSLAESARAPRLNNRLNKIKAPTLILWGKEDYMIPVKFIDPFVKMKNCRVVLLENCGHRPHFERPELFNRIVSDFLLY
jgi:2-hydroxy-6-oxonona-2,4-dienedioate hydrolase